jgi:hypothetical protein
VRVVVALVVQFVEKSGKGAAIGLLQDVGHIVSGTAGTNTNKVKRFA